MQRGWLLTTLMVASFATAAEVPPPPGVYGRTVGLVRELYFEADEADPPAMLHAAADALAQQVPWLTSEADDAHVRLRDGHGHVIAEAAADDWDDLPGALFSLEVALAEHGDDVGDLDVRHAVLDGATNALDRYSKVLVGDGLDRFDTRLKGTLVGIGTRVRHDDEHLVVSEVFPDGPAEAAGVQVGDVLLRIGGRSTVNMPVSEAVRHLRGDEGTVVEVQLARDGVEQVVPITRAQVILPNVHHDVLEGGVGYVAIDHVSQKTVYNLRRAVADLAQRGGLSRGLVLDLRGNTGGSMKESAGVVDQLVEDGLLLATVGRDGRPVRNLMARMEARDAGDEPPVPVVVLVDRRTASGAEIITGGLIEHDRVVVLGQRTYGKGRVQKIYDIDDDARLKLTVAEYVLQNERRIRTTGIRPDVTFGDVYLHRDGVRFGAGWDLEREQVDWDDVVPLVTESATWRAAARDPGDVVLEAARHAILAAPGPTRPHVLSVLPEVVAQIRAREEGAFVNALEARGIDWSAAPGPGMRPEARVEVTAVSVGPDDVEVRVTVHNDGPTTLHRTLVRLSCESFSTWDDLVVPIGAVPSGGMRQGRVALGLPLGMPERHDKVEIALHTDARPLLDVAPTILAAATPPDPRFAVDLQLRGSGADRTARVTVTNLDDVTVEGLEAEFGYPEDVPVELLDQGARQPRLAPKGTVSFDLGVHLVDPTIAEIPLRLRVASEDHDRLLQWEVPLPTDGTSVHRRAPDLAIDAGPPSGPLGHRTVRLVASDDGALEHLVAFLDGDKIAYVPGDGRSDLEAPVPLDLTAGSHVLHVRVTDDDGLVTRSTRILLGVPDDEGIAVDD